jgi:glycosyltransferase involved in cell wall biosynthesis
MSDSPHPVYRVISFIVPAHNEQSCIGRTLEAIHEAARSIGQQYEIVVVDDASTDSTEDIARHHNATVTRVNHRQIAATRNSGGRAAHGERLFFVDADTTINARAVASHCNTWTEVLSVAVLRRDSTKLHPFTHDCCCCGSVC